LGENDYIKILIVVGSNGVSYVLYAGVWSNGILAHRTFNGGILLVSSEAYNTLPKQRQATSQKRITFSTARLKKLFFENFHPIGELKKHISDQMGPLQGLICTSGGCVP
jgi:hypothetical protein